MNGLQFYCIKSVIENNCSEEECVEIIECISNRRAILKKLKLEKIWESERLRLLSISNEYEKEIHTIVFIPDQIRFISQDVLYIIKKISDTTYIIGNNAIFQIRRCENDYRISDHLRGFLKLLEEFLNKNIYINYL
jgi:hypothetical protein